GGRQPRGRGPTPLGRGALLVGQPPSLVVGGLDGAADGVEQPRRGAGTPGRLVRQTDQPAAVLAPPGVPVDGPGRDAVLLEPGLDEDAQRGGDGVGDPPDT